ncbi:ATP-binding protein [Streptomyces sp. NPDC021098]|uniref:ATP-binding protein n=1 Tax=unclassified Streptomyces TaxID=2593676 RepID=UPI00379C418E
MTAAAGPDPAGPLLARLALLRERIAALVARRGEGDPTADDPMRGLYVSPEAAHHLLHAPPVREQVADEDAYAPLLRGQAPERTGRDRVAEVAARFGLLPLDVHILLVAVAPEVDRSLEPLYGYLNDDVGRRRACVSLAVELAGLPAHSAAARARFHPSAPLVRHQLLDVADEDRPLPGRGLRVPERVVAHLLGDDAPTGELLGAVAVSEASGAGRERQGDSGGEFFPRLAGLAVRVRDEGSATSADLPAVVHVREAGPAAVSGPAITALNDAGLPVLRLDPSARSADAVAGLTGPLLREARLRGAGVVAGPLPREAGALVRALCAAAPGEAAPDAGAEAAPGTVSDGPSAAPVPVVLFGPHPFDPGWTSVPVPSFDAPDTGAAPDAWADAVPADETAGFDLAAAVSAYRLDPERAGRAVTAARGLAALDGGRLTADHVQRAARQQSAPALERHARRVEPGVDWSDLVLPDEPLERLRELVSRARHRERVLREWRLRPGGGRGRGVVALFTGESGTGKTLSAEVVAAELGLDLYVVDLSALVDKYIGETEKNLERVFAEADRTDAVLLFDEADAVFGKRGEVKDAHDRYANLESAYLLQRLESFHGIAVLTSNFRGNIDEAFTRRLDLVVDFPFPDAEHRLALWQGFLKDAPCAPDLELRRCAAEFELAGGGIRGAAVTAGYRAAARGSALSTDDVLEGARREYRKAGRLVVSGGALY